MWLQKGAQVTLVPEHMPDTITRCLDDGWVEIPDPRIPAAPVPVSTPEQPHMPAHPVPHVRQQQKGRR